MPGRGPADGNTSAVAEAVILALAELIDQLDDAALAHLAQPHGLAADGVEDRAQRTGRGFGASSQDEQLALYGRALAA
jgi:hypothetical protein